ncbi:MAG: glycosyltransferase family 4 protein [Pirellulaceae bacterium]
MKKTIPVLYAHASSLVGGGNKVLLSLMEGLDRKEFTPISVIPEPGPLQDDLRRLDVPYWVVDLRAGRLSRVAQAVAASRLVVRRFGAGLGVLHANEQPYRTAAFASLGMARVCHVHHPGSSPGGLKWLFKQRPHLVLTPSQFVRDEVLACLAGAGIETRVEVAWNPIDLDWFQPLRARTAVRARLGMELDRQHISILGALTPHKGHQCFLRMARVILNQCPMTSFHIVGNAMGREATYTESLRQLAGDLEISDRVRFWGFTEDEVARDILAASDIFVLPTAEEGFGLVLAEAQACEVPVLSTAIRPLDEVVDDGRTGYLLRLNEHEAFAQRAIELLQSAELRQAMGAAGRQWVQSRFSRAGYVASIMSLYRQVLSHN